MCYLPHGEEQYAAAARSSYGGQEWGRLATCGGEGTLRLWGVTGEASSPLQLLLTVEVSNRGVGIGHARSVSWDRSGTTIALGTVGNAVCLVQPGEVRFSRHVSSRREPRGRGRFLDGNLKLRLECVLIDLKQNGLVSAKSAINSIQFSRVVTREESRRKKYQRVGKPASQYTNFHERDGCTTELFDGPSSVSYRPSGDSYFSVKIFCVASKSHV